MSAVNSFKITTLVEDTCPKRPFKGEHGLSFFIEVDDKKILFDTGLSGDVLIENTGALSLDLSQLDAFVLSHPHDDHSGGLYKIKDYLKNIPFYCVTNTFQEYIPHRQELEKILTDVRYVKENTEIFRGVWIPKQRKTTNSPKKTREINLAINFRDKGVIAVVGCAHHGLMNIVKDAQAVFDNKLPIYALIGGLHLKDTADEKIIEWLSEIRKQGLKYLLPNHCTGFNALRVMAEEFPNETRLIVKTPTGTFYTGMSWECN